jgi:hypothetical protein
VQRESGLPHRGRFPGRHRPRRRERRSGQLLPLEPDVRWLKLGIVVDEAASDDQTAALERIFKGEDGGPFADFAALTEEWLGTERGSVTFSDGDKPSGSIAGAEFTFEPLPGPEGSDAQATVRNAMFGFAPEFRIGRAPSHQSALGIEFDAIYGETADYEFSSELPEGAPRGRG